MAGYVKANSSNLPKVDIFMIHEVLKQDDRLNIAEVAGVKALSSTRESYGDTAIGYVELKREGFLCTVRARICPEHKVRSKAYSVQIIVNQTEGKVVDVSCTDFAAAPGGCKHALAFLTWLNRRSEDPSPTEITSYWKKPLLSGVGSSVKFVKVCEFGKKTTGDGTTKEIPDPTEFFNSLLEEGKREQIDSQLTCSSSVFKENF